MDYIDINKKSWNNRLDAHLESSFYNMPAFMEGETSLNGIELGLLGDVRGKKILHLQCHFGQDTMSLSRLGAQVTGVDLSDKAIAKAQVLAQELGLDTKFICCDIYELDKYLDEKFDLVFTSYGAIVWLPDLNRWAEVIRHFLKPNGQFLMVEFHPVVWMFDDELTYIQYPYFNRSAILETETGTYADRSADLTQPYVNWNHSLSEVMMSLINQGVTIQDFQEYDYSPYNVFVDMVEASPKRYRIRKMDDKFPLVYSLLGTK